MGIYKSDYDYNITINKLKANFIDSCFELQLLWLVEILVLKMFLYLRDNSPDKLNRAPNGDYLFKQSSVFKVLQDFDLNTDTVSTLVLYRNKFVHVGYLDAKTIADDLVENNMFDLITIAHFIGVNLNFNKRLI